MRLMILCATALALSACASTPAQIATTAQIASTAQAGLYAAATLARAGTIDEQLAPAYTQNAMVRQRAARLLDAGRIDVAIARRVLTQTDAARTAAVSGDISRADRLAQLSSQLNERIAIAQGYNLDRKQTIITVLDDIRASL